MSGHTEMEAFVTWLMVGGGIVFSFGLSFSLANINGIDKGGLSRPLAYVGLAFVGLGAVLGSHWNIFW